MISARPFELLGIPADRLDEANVAREKLVEMAVEMDDGAMEAYLEGQEPSVATLKACIRQGGAGRRLRARAVRKRV